MVNKCKHCRGKGTAGGSSYVFEACAYCQGTGKLNEKTLEGVKEMKLGITTRAIKEWSVQKGLSEANPDKQFKKLIEEAGELAEAINKDLSDEEKMMEAGDVFIVLTIMMQQYGFDIEDCAELAYNKIANRQGKMVNGVFVKESDL